MYGDIKELVKIDIPVDADKEIKESFIEYRGGSWTITYNIYEDKVIAIEEDDYCGGGSKEFETLEMALFTTANWC